MDDQLKFNTIPRQGTFGKVVDTTNKNFELAKVAIDGLVYATHRNKGLFGTLEALNDKYPSPNYGDWALVGSSFPCQVYRCDANTHTWVAAGTYQGDNISLNDYVTKAQHNEDMETIEGEIEDLHEAIYGVSVEQELTFTDHGSAQALETTIPLGSKIFLSGDLAEVLGMTNVSDTEHQTITSGTITDRSISYIKNGSTTGSVTITAIVENGLKRDVEAIKYDYTDFENKLRGVGQNANGSLYPMYNLGDFANINEVNDAVDSAFATQGNTIKQGRLKMRRNGQIIFVDQFAIDFSQGRWAQMAYGMVAPSSQDDGLTLIQATDHPHIVWRMNGVDNGKWRDLEGNISLKTINGNSLYGEGDLTISDAAQIVVDTALDPSSDNAIANSAVAAVVAEIYSTFAEAVQQVMKEKGTIICKVWQGNTNWPSAITTPIGTYGFDTTKKELLRVNDLQAWTHIDLSEEIVYVDAVNNKQYRWNGSDMISIGGGNNVSVVDNVVRGNYNPVTSNAVAVAMSQFGIDEVAVIKCWSDDSQDYDNWEMGEYWYDPTEDELWRCNDQQGADFEKVLRPIIMLKEPNYDVWIWNTQTAKKFDVETETSISAETAESTNPPTTAAVYEKVHAIEEAIDDINMEDYRKNSDEENELLYPEYWFDVIEDEKKALDPSYEKKEIIYAKNYYDWNLVKYNYDAEDIVANATADKAFFEAEKVSLTAKKNATTDSDRQTLLQRYIDRATTIISELTDDINNATTRLANVQDYVAINVLYPSEELTDTTKYYVENIEGIEVDARNVYYSRDLECFILKATTTTNGVSTTAYYKKWGNSNLWQDENGNLRSDTIFSRIRYGERDGFLPGYEGASNEDRGRLWKTVAYVYRGGSLVDIFNTFTDFAPAINRCIQANDGKCRLHSTKIYGCASNIYISSVSSVDFNGQNSVICRLPSKTIGEQRYSGTTDTLASWNTAGNVIGVASINNVVIENVKLLCVNLAIKNSASDLNFTYTSSNLYGISATNGNDIRVHNVEFQNCAKDMDFQTGTIDKLVIEGWKSKACNGMFCGGVLSLIIDGADLVQRELGSEHLIYCGWVEKAASHVIKNSRFIQNSKFNTNFVQYKTGHTSTPSSPDTFTPNGTDYIVPNVRFFNCHMRIGRGMIFYSPYNDLHLTFDNCTILQHDKFVSRLIGSGSKAYTADTVGFWGGVTLTNFTRDASGIIQFTDRANLKIKDTTFKVWNKPVYMSTPSDKYNNSPATPDYVNIELENVQVLLNSPSGYASGQHGRTDAVSKVISIMGDALSKGKPAVKTSNVLTNYVQVDAPFPVDNTTPMPKNNGSTFVNQPYGFSFFNTTLKKMLWLTDYVYNWKVWTSSDGTEYSDINNIVTTHATAPVVTGSSNLGYVYDNTSFTPTKRLALFNVDNSINTWIDNSGAAYDNDGNSVIVKDKSSVLDNLEISDYFLNISTRKAYFVIAKVSLSVSGTSTIFMGLKNGNDFYNKSYTKLTKGTTGESGGAGTAPSGTGSKTPSIGAAYYNTNINDVLFYAGIEGTTKIWVDSNGNQYDYYGSSIR